MKNQLELIDIDAGFFCALIKLQTHLNANSRNISEKREKMNFTTAKMNQNCNCFGLYFL